MVWAVTAALGCLVGCIVGLLLWIIGILQSLKEEQMQAYLSEGQWSSAYKYWIVVGLVAGSGAAALVRCIHAFNVFFATVFVNDFFSLSLSLVFA